MTTALVLATLGCGPAEAQVGEADKPQRTGTQDPQKQGPKKNAPTTVPIPTNPKELLELLTKNGIRVDTKASTVTIESEVGRPADPLEYVLIHRKGKTHEAMLITEVVPSLLNTALLAIGLEPGENARVEEIQPPPTIEEVRAGAPWLNVFPPKGKTMYVTVSWEHDGKKHTDVPVEELLLDATTGLEVKGNRWVFLGGNWAPLLRGEDPVFMGDYQGNIVSSCYMHPPNHLVTIVHERGNDEMNWWLTEKCPPTGTKIRVTFHKDMPPSVKKREERLAKEALKEAAENAKKDEGGDKKQPGSEDNTGR